MMAAARLPHWQCRHATEWPGPTSLSAGSSGLAIKLPAAASLSRVRLAPDRDSNSDSEPASESDRS